MFRGGRCILVAFVGWLSLAAQQPPQDKAGTKQAEKVEQPAPPYAPYGPLSKDPCYRSPSHDTADLCAQWRAAFAAEKAAAAAQSAENWTIVGTFLSAFALGALLWALRQTERALELERVPFLVVRIEAEKVEWDGKQLTPDPLLFSIENVGRGPATVTKLHREWAISKAEEYPPPINRANRSPSSYTKDVHITVGPGSKSDTLDSFHDKLFPSILKKSKLPRDGWISFMGYVEFQDLAKNTYVSGFHHLFRLDRTNRSMHLALPEERAEQYNYHRKKPRRRWFGAVAT